MKDFFKTDSWDDNSTILKFTTNFKSNKRSNVANDIEKEMLPPIKRKKIRESNNSDEKLQKSKKPSVINKNYEPVVACDVKQKKKKNNNALRKNMPTLPITKIQSETSSNFQNKLREELMGGRFRFLNEQLYTVPGSTAKQIFDEDTEAFEAYHKGYRHQVAKWPFNPLDRIIKRVNKLPKHLVIADFGCGEAKLAQSIKNKCYSMDLVSAKSDIIACDMAATPLSANSTDVAIYCLSLMGTNLEDFILEANRVLKMGGLVYVAEIASRFEKNTKEFENTFKKMGFKLIRKDFEKQYFYFFDFKKVTDAKKTVSKSAKYSLKPCIYKKR